MSRLQIGAVLSIPLHRERLKALALQSRELGDTAYAEAMTATRDHLARVMQAAWGMR